MKCVKVGSVGTLTGINWESGVIRDHDYDYHQADFKNEQDAFIKGLLFEGQIYWKCTDDCMMFGIESCAEMFKVAENSCFSFTELAHYHSKEVKLTVQVAGITSYC